MLSALYNPFEAGTELIRKRYKIESTLGAGGMGVVYRAADRLTGQPVALKQVLVPPGLLEFMTRSKTEEFYVGLAREFQSLASLRHPNIISVYDYGFDDQRQPFLVMERLENALEIPVAGAQLPLADRIQLLQQMFEAINYLHRRGIIHRDLKPSNVLAVRQTDYQVKVLDFGLSIRHGEQGGAEGTLGYIAPEVLQGGASSTSADLYAAGVIACELFTGRQPFAADSLDDLVRVILTAPLDLSGFDLPESLEAILTHLLARNPDERYANAREVLADLNALAGNPVIETVAIRESFLQAANFVGREPEMAQLTAALSKSLAGQGSAWLVGGESGVGKSRLLDELRIRALVQGVSVLRGQSAEGGKLPFQLWRDSLRHLILTTELTDLEAGILKPLIPDIETLLDRPIADVPELPGRVGFQRLTRTIVDLFRRQTAPLLLILEDLHWSTDESLIPLGELCRALADLPIMVVGSYRSDETLNLPQQLPDMTPIMLHRLQEEEISELCISMLGPSGQQPEVTALLQRETEGNVFFLVEVVRALAEEAGSLAGIGKHILPDSVLTSGLQNIIQRRITGVSEPARELLKLAAIIGRTIDIPVLRMARPEMDFEKWLMECSAAAIFDVQDNQWRFAHNKFRETIIHNLTVTEKRGLYHQGAAALESAYGTDQSRAGQIAYYWNLGGDAEKERYYSMRACDYYLKVNLFQDAHRYAERAYNLSKDGASKETYLDALVRLVRSYWRLSEYQQARPLLEEGLALAQQLDRKDLLTDMNLIMGGILKRLDSPQAGQQFLNQSLAIARDTGNRAKEAEALLALINPLMDWDLREARSVAQAALDIYQALGDEVGEANAIFRMAMTLLEPHELTERRQLYERAGEIFKKHSIRLMHAQILMNLVNLDMMSCSYTTARDFAEEGLRLVREAGSKSYSAYMLLYLSQPLFELGEPEQAETHAHEALAIFRSTQEIAGTAYALSNLGDILRRRGKFTEAREALRESTELSRQHELWELLMSALTHMGMTLADESDFAAARQCWSEAMTIAMNWGLTIEKLRILSGVVYSAARAHNDIEAVEYATFLLNFPHIDQSTIRNLLPLLETAQQRLSPELIHEATERGRAHQLDQIVAQIAKDG